MNSTEENRLRFHGVAHVNTQLLMIHENGIHYLCSITCWFQQLAL